MSEAVSTETVLSALKWRYAVKAFDPSKKIPVGVWSALEQSLVLSPSSFGLQPWKFIVVTDAGVKAKLREKAWGQGQVTDCSHYVVVARKTSVGPAEVDRFFKAMTATTGTPEAAVQGYKQMMLGFVTNPAIDTGTWAARQAYIALGFLLESAALLRVDACPIEGFDPKAFDEILGLPAEGYNAVVTCALGYRAVSDKYAAAPKVRYPAAELIRHV